MAELTGFQIAVFTYRTGSDNDPDNDDGIWIGNHTRTLELDAILNHVSTGTQSGHKVDTS